MIQSLGVLCKYSHLLSFFSAVFGLFEGDFCLFEVYFVR